MNNKMLELALANKTKLQVKLDKLNKQLTPLKEELVRVQQVINLFQQEQSPKVIIPDADLRPEKQISVVDMLRIILKPKPDGLNTDAMKSLCNLAWPNQYDKFTRGMHNALIFLVNSAEVNKLGTGHIAVYKPTITLQLPKE
jgi:hypothetical protein